jgi:hypothetical protein
MPATGKLRYSTGFNLPFSGDELLQQFSFISLKNGNTKITAAKNDFGGGNGGATSLATADVKLFNAGQPNPNATVSYKGNGTKFFSTPTADTSQSVQVTQAGGAGQLKVKQSATTSNQTLANKLYGLTTGNALILAGAATAAILLFVYLRK